MPRLTPPRPGAFVARLVLLALAAATASAETVPASSPVARGEYLARAANCLACHQAEGGQPFAGGRPFRLPFGTLYSTNITPDRETGIGRWRDEDFVRAMHQGKGPDGRRYYPAFPYTAYTLMPREDVLAIKAYLFSLAPVRQENRRNALRFPYNQRWGLALWNLLFHRDRRYATDAGRSAEWNRGAYLVRGPGHCGECHTPRNWAQARRDAREMAGNTVQGWHAWNISADVEAGIGGWPDRALADYLATGVAEGYGVASGPMAEVVEHSLRHLAPGDIQAMVTYLKSVPAQPAAVHRENPPHRPGDPTAHGTPLGRRLFAGACADCHAWDGRGRQGAHTALLGLRAVRDPQGTNLIRVLLDGGHLRKPGDPSHMPSFASAHGDHELAALANFVLEHFGGVPGRLSAGDIARARQAD